MVAFKIIEVAIAMVLVLGAMEAAVIGTKFKKNFEPTDEEMAREIDQFLATIQSLFDPKKNTTDFPDVNGYCKCEDTHCRCCQRFLWKEFCIVLEHHSRSDLLEISLKCGNRKIISHTFSDYCRNTSIVCDCSDIKSNGYTTSEVYLMYVVDEGQRYYANVFCDMTTRNGAWTVFQRRKDGSVDFYRDWCDYANGFGNSNGEFWLGNNFLHLLTSKRRYRLRIDLEDFEGEKRYAEYSTFNISSSADKYRLRIGSYYGTAGDNLSYNNGHRFTTKDNDNDAHPSGNCAVTYRGAWWFSNDCGYSNLNGLYLRGSYSLTSGTGITWYAWHGFSYSLKTTEMKISSA